MRFESNLATQTFAILMILENNSADDNLSSSSSLSNNKVDPQFKEMVCALPVISFLN